MMHDEFRTHSPESAIDDEEVQAKLVTGFEDEDRRQKKPDLAFRTRNSIPKSDRAEGRNFVD